MPDWYTKTGAPSENASLDSGTIRSEFALVEAAMAKLPTLTGNGSKLVAVNAGATALEAISSATVAQGGTGKTSLTAGALLLGNGTSAIAELAITTDGAIVIGDGAAAPTTLSAFTSSTGTLKHEYGGIEANISAIADGGMLVGTGAGTMAIRASMLTGGASGYLKHEVGGLEADVSAIANGGLLVGTGAGTIGVRSGVLTDGATGYLKHELGGLEKDISGITDGDFIVGTGAGTLGLESGATVRASLGLTIGTNVQAYDAGLASIAGLTTAADKGIYTTASDTYATFTLTSYGRGLVAVADEAAFKALVNLEVGTDVQAYDAELAAIAGLISAADKMPYFTGSGTAALATITSAARSVLDDASVSDMRTTLGVAIGSNVQAYDAGLASIAGLTTAADKMIYTTALDTYAVTALTSTARSLLDDGSTSAMRTTLGLGTMATRNVTISTSSPSGGSNGDIWFVREA